jgi:hypothetical protein
MLLISMADWSDIVNHHVGYRGSADEGNRWAADFELQRPVRPGRLTRASLQLGERYPYLRPKTWRGRDPHI